MNVYRLFFTPILFNWNLFHFLFYGVFCSLTFYLFKKHLTTIQNVHLTVLSLLTIQLIWELPLNLVAVLSVNSARQYYFAFSYCVRFLPFGLLFYTLKKFSFASVKLIVIGSLITIPVATLLLGFYFVQAAYLIRVVYATPFLLFINKIEERKT